MTQNLSALSRPVPSTARGSARAPSKLVLCELQEVDDGVPSHSPFCVKAIAALRYAGLPYQSQRADAPGAFKAHNPTGQVPVLLKDDVPVCDSTTIVAEIDDLSGGRLSADLDARERAEALLWEDYADTALNGFLVAARWADDDNWPRTRQAYFGSAPAPVRWLIAPRIRAGIIRRLKARDVWLAGPASCWARFEACLDQLDARAPKEGYWVAKTLSVADVAIYAQLASLRTTLTPRQGASLAERTVLSAYVDRVAAAVAGPDAPA